MIELQLHGALLLIVWGMVVALDLVSVPQGLLSRPLVAGTVAGWIAGDLEAGLRMGVLFECFALDVLPIGAVRYPDYGPATVVAAASGMYCAGSVSSCSRNTPSAVILPRACRSAEHETASATGQEAPCRGSRITRTSWQKYFPRTAPRSRNFE